MISFGLLSLIFAIKATKQLNSNKTLLFVSISAFFGTLSLSVKYIGSFYLTMSGLVVFYCFWSRVVPRKDLTAPQILLKMSSVYFLFFITFLATYSSIFYVHLHCLTQAGPHDSVMTSAFQASLKGGLASIIKGQPIQVSHGSQVTLRHSLGRPCWMHSHLHNYPIKYGDGRGSSHQQQVTCYSFKDVNNWWIVKRPLVENLAVNETKDVIKHGDEIHLVHGMSGRLLNSHDVAAPQSPQNQEVSCYIDHNVSMSAEPLWRVEIIGGCGGSTNSEGCEWHAVKSTVRLIHVTSGQALRMSGKQLPKWGFHQHEVVTDRIVVQDDTVWNVEEHRYTKSEKDREKELLEAEMIPTKPTIISFPSKFWELQWKMLVSSGSSQTESHAYASFPSEWFLLSRGIAYWIGSGGTNAQIHLLGNPLIWWVGSFGLLAHLSLVGFYLLRRRRLCFDIDEDQWSSILLQSAICLGGYGLTYVYHFCVDRTLFLHHYLPSYVFKIMLLVSTVHHLHTISKRVPLLRYLLTAVLLTWIAGVVHAYTKFLPTSIGYPALSRSELESLKWNHNWDFIVQNST